MRSGPNKQTLDRQTNFQLLQSNFFFCKDNIISSIKTPRKGEILLNFDFRRKAKVTKSILKKYDGQLPRLSDVRANQNIKKILAKLDFNKIIVNRVIGKGTKNIVNQLPLSESITLHSARRSFINLMISKGVSIAHLSTMVGKDLKSLSINYKDDTSQMKKVMDKVKLFK